MRDYFLVLRRPPRSRTRVAEVVATLRSWWIDRAPIGPGSRRCSGVHRLRAPVASAPAPPRFPLKIDGGLGIEARRGHHESRMILRPPPTRWGATAPAGLRRRQAEPATSTRIARGRDHPADPRHRACPLRGAAVPLGPSRPSRAATDCCSSRTRPSRHRERLPRPTIGRSGTPLLQLT